jgi:hypothetical protein
VPIGPQANMNTEAKPVRVGGKKKSPLIVKISLDEATSLRLLTSKPNSIPTSGFCAMMIEYGLKAWERVEQDMDAELCAPTGGD